MRIKMGMFLQCPQCQNWYCIEESFVCPCCSWDKIEVLKSEDSCPKCKWKPNDYENWCVRHISKENIAEIEFAGTHDDWVEIWYCPECGALFSREIFTYY